MKNIAIAFGLVTLVAMTALSQMSLLSSVNATSEKLSFVGPDSLRPWRTDQGVRTVWVTKDCNKNGKPEIVATNYSNGGHVYVYEFTSPGTLEMIWSSPSFYTTNNSSTPRWVRDGDLDGDGNRELIFPVGPRHGGKIVAFEWDPIGHTFGDVPAIELPFNYFVATLGASAEIRMDRETGTVDDFDGDGKDELIAANENQRVYILGVAGDIPGFGAWQLEGGDPAVNPENRFSGGSWWHSVFGDFYGDTKKEIVNHYWNLFGFWSIIPTGTDTYRYPKPHADSAALPSKVPYAYHEYMDSPNDAVAYMGVQPIDVNGDGKKEIAGILYIGGTPEYDYQPCLVSLSHQDTGLYVWKDSSQFGVIGHNVWEVSGATTGSFWGVGAYDFNGNGREELYLGGTPPYELIKMEYKGTGSIFDPASYNNSVAYAGVAGKYYSFTINDSLGIKKDTTKTEAPFISKMFAGTDLNGNGKKEIVAAYQSTYDSIRYIWNKWNVAGSNYILDSSKGVNGKQTVVNPSCLNIKLLEYTGSSFVELPYAVVTPDEYVLEQNYPNPFNPSTVIRFSLPIDKQVSLKVYDMTGREVKTLINDEKLDKGGHSAEWNGKNNAGKSVASGTYIYTLKFGAFTKSGKMLFMK
jgi:hypothetical protein